MKQQNKDAERNQLNSLVKYTILLMEIVIFQVVVVGEIWSFKNPAFKKAKQEDCYNQITAARTKLDAWMMIARLVTLTN